MVITLKKVNVVLTISSDVYLDDEIIKNAEEELGGKFNEIEVAQRLLFAFINPKLPDNHSLKEDEGYWDGVCSFKDKIKNISLTL